MVALCHTAAALLYMKIKLFDLYQVTAAAGAILDPLPVSTMATPQAVVRSTDLSHSQAATETGHQIHVYVQLHNGQAATKNRASDTCICTVTQLDWLNNVSQDNKLRTKFKSKLYPIMDISFKQVLDFNPIFKKKNTNTQ